MVVVDSMDEFNPYDPALLLGERMTAVQVLGASCIIGGAMVGELIKRKAKR